MANKIAKYILGNSIVLKAGYRFDSSQDNYQVNHDAKIFMFFIHQSSTSEPVMALKRPLCMYNGTPAELAVGDTLPGFTIVSREVPTGVKDGSNAIFTLSETPILGSEQVYLNGVLQNAGAGNDYAILGKTITFGTPLLASDTLLITYWR